MYLLLYLLMGIIPCMDSYQAVASSLYQHRGKNIKLDGRSDAFIQRGNTENPPGSWPWVCSLGGFNPETGDWVHLCTGVIASNNQIITTVGCMDHLEESMGDNDKIHALAGDNNYLAPVDDFDVQIREMLNYVIHPMYDEMHPNYHDIAILIVKKPFNFSKYVRPIELPEINENGDVVLKEDGANELLIFSDWGKSMSISTRSILIQPAEICQKSYPSMVFTKELMCGVNPRSLSKMCDVSYGTPIVKQNNQIKRYVLKGLFSMDIFEPCEDNKHPNLMVPISSKCNIQFIYTQLYDVTFPKSEHDTVCEIPEIPEDERIYEDCGRNHILNGEPEIANSQLTKYPWQVSLGHTDQSNPKVWTHLCGGSIVTPTKIITAAHCASQLSEMKVLIQVRAGDDRLQNPTDDAGLQIEDVQSYISHPDWEFRYFDVGVITLASPLKMTKFVSPICLLTLAEAKKITKQKETGLTLMTTGWGKDGSGKYGEDLKDILHSVLSEEKCNETHKETKTNRNSVPKLFGGDLLCAADPTGAAGTCKGDSGGPAVHLDQKKQRYFLRAIVSGSALGICGTNLFPNIYVRTADLRILKWILEQVKQAPKAISIEGKIEANHNEVVQYKCLVDSNPASEITWIVKDDSGQQTRTNGSSVEFDTKNNSQTFSITCTARNRNGKLTLTKTQIVEVARVVIDPKTASEVIIIPVVILLLLVLLVVFFILYLKKTQRFDNIKNRFTKCCASKKNDDLDGESKDLKCYGPSHNNSHDEIEVEFTGTNNRPTPSSPDEPDEKPLLPKPKIIWKSETQRLAKISHGETGVWGVNSDGKIFRKVDNGKWKMFDGPKLVDISVGHGEIWGVDINDDVYRFIFINQHAKDPWEKMEKELIQVSVSPLKSNNPDIWGCDRDNKIFHRQSKGEWRHIKAELKIMMVSIGEAGVWVINDQDDAYYRDKTYRKIENYTGAAQAFNPAGWTLVPAPPGAKLKWVSSGEDRVWVVNKDDEIFYRDGISNDSHTGSDWVPMKGSKLKQIDVWGKSLYGVNANDRVYYSKEGQ